MSTRPHKVRFHLANGPNFLKWQVKDAEGNVEFYEPTEVSLELTNCFLRNQRGTAEKIHEGADKTVCAWVECEKVEVTKYTEEPGLDHEGVKEINVNDLVNLHYNPRVLPFWNIYGVNVDGKEYDTIISLEKTLYIISP